MGNFYTGLLLVLDLTVKQGCKELKNGQRLMYGFLKPDRNMPWNPKNWKHMPSPLT
jgi:hypothetical protein